MATFRSDAKKLIAERVVVNSPKPTANTESQFPPPQLTPWKPGESGNPSGRPKALQAIVAKGREWSMELFEQLHMLALMHADVNIRMRATEMILDRTFGKPKQQVDLVAQLEHTFVIRVPTVAPDDATWEKQWGDRLIEGGDNGERPGEGSKRS